MEETITNCMCCCQLSRTGVLQSCPNTLWDMAKVRLGLTKEMLSPCVALCSFRFPYVTCPKLPSPEVPHDSWAEQTLWHPPLCPTPSVMMLKDLDGPAPGICAVPFPARMCPKTDTMSYQLFTLVMSRPLGSVQGRLSCLVSCEGKGSLEPCSGK